MERLKNVAGLVVSQKKEWGEILTGFETKNKYVISDDQGNMLYRAAEEGGSFLVRAFLKGLRPFEILVLDQTNQILLKVNRPFRFYFHEVTVSDHQGRVIGSLKKQFTILRRKYSVLDEQGVEKFQLDGPLLRPWTFLIKSGDTEYGKITKKWSGLLKEGFTDADNFGVVFPEEWDIKLKALFLGAVFLIDFVHFENVGRT